MVLVLGEADWRAIFPRAPTSVVEAFVGGAALLAVAGITMSRTRLAYALANVAHECDGYALPALTENIHYCAESVARTWPTRFPDAAAVRKAYGTGYGWQQKAIDEVYGERMGNGRGTNDGSRYIGRGGPQLTGREEYWEVGQRCGLDLVNRPELAAQPRFQPAILAAFWSWKGLNAQADAGNFHGCVEKWKGRRIGIADREARIAGRDTMLSRLMNLAALMPVLEPIRPAPTIPAALAPRRCSI
ncbi:glycoside hydrolase family 19 protein [Neorhizobium sp. NPDC001467]|uniref:glycoside hydrolase family 19 protein n=1 Tax=Neorhizobium sp. NPDC001467 TaxID=3390595 RepID=UPI003D0878D0